MTLDPMAKVNMMASAASMVASTRKKDNSSRQYEFVWVPDSMHVDHVLQEDTAPKSILSEEDKEEKEALPPPPPESSGSPISGFPGFSGSPTLGYSQPKDPRFGGASRSNHDGDGVPFTIFKLQCQNRNKNGGYVHSITILLYF